MTADEVAAQRRAATIAGHQRAARRHGELSAVMLAIAVAFLASAVLLFITDGFWRGSLAVTAGTTMLAVSALFGLLASRSSTRVEVMQISDELTSMRTRLVEMATDSARLNAEIAEVAAEVRDGDA